MPDGVIRIGTSGWSYDHWRPGFYPERLARRRWLDYYQERFPTVEVNATFYRLPRASMVRGWHDSAPPNFRYAVKGSRFITHTRSYDQRGEAIERFFGLVTGLKTFLGVVLWQFPDFVERDLQKLARFLSVLPGGTGHAIEFRHPSWLEDETFDLLREHRAAFVAVSSNDMPDMRAVTGPFAYVRFHGLRGGYSHNYTDAELRPWSDWARELAADGTDGFFFFNNDGEARAPNNALRFMEMIGDAAIPWGDHD